jgi:microcystin-dependent protein
MITFLGTILPSAFNFAPNGWALCDGSEMQIENHGELFKLIGTTYGGDGKKYFNLPDMRGRAVVHMGAGPGLTPRKIGETGGNNQVVISGNNIPANPGNLPLPRKSVSLYGPVLSDTQPVSVVQPFIAVHYIISLYGIYPYAK